MIHREHAEMLKFKAEQDEYVLNRLLDDPQAPLEVFGFHAQQAAEKLLKAVLAAQAVDYPRTHRLHLLIDVLAKNGIRVPEELFGILEWSQFAVELRYERLREDVSPELDKNSVYLTLRELRRWVESTVDNILKDVTD